MAAAVGTIVPAPPESPPEGARTIAAVEDQGDRIFRIGTGFSGAVVLAIMVGVGLFLTIQGLQALKVAKFSFLTTSAWSPETHHFGVAALLFGTVAIAFIAVAVAFPLSLGTALFITDVAPARLRSYLIAMLDLMAAVPSVVYGLWGAKFLTGHTLGLARWISAWFSWIPIFRVSGAGADPHSPLANATVYTASAFVAGLVVALMVMPIQCSVMREVFSQVPAGEREGAYALGATRWGMIRTVSLSFGRGGIIGGTMLGLGRALGETIAVLLIISPVFKINWHVLQAGSNSVSALIANLHNEASGFGLSALFAAGLALFAITLAVNFTASIFVARSRSGASSEV
jgi:phosphate transport system permease protein